MTHLCRALCLSKVLFARLIYRRLKVRTAYFSLSKAFGDLFLEGALAI
jgi:hypothetical protein